jgi:hypothetical protein
MIAALPQLDFAFSWGHHAVGVSRRGSGRVRPAVAATA